MHFGPGGGSSLSLPPSIRGTAIVRAGGGGQGGYQGPAGAQGLAHMRHEEGVTGQLQYVNAVLLPVGQATADEGLRLCRDHRFGGKLHLGGFKDSVLL